MCLFASKLFLFNPSAGNYIGKDSNINYLRYKNINLNMASMIAHRMPLKTECFISHV